MFDFFKSHSSERILVLRDKLEIKDITSARPEDIADFNKSELSKKKSFNLLYRPVQSGIQCDSFIIPVSDGGSIAGYLFKNKRTTPTGSGSLIIYYHDGGWALGNMDSCLAVCGNICKATGIAVLTVDYRLAPEFKFPIPVEDCYSAFLWAQKGAKYWKLDPSQIYLMGTEAGGNLAIAVSKLARDRQGPRPAGQILIDPITDCRLRTTSMSQFANNPALPLSSIAHYIDMYQREPKDILDPYFSPLLALDHSRLPASLILGSEFSPLHDDARLYAEALASADTPVRFITLKGQVHGMIKYPGSYNWNNNLRAIADFICGTGISKIEILTKKERLRRRKPEGIPSL